MSLQSDDTSVSPRMIHCEEEAEPRGHTHCLQRPSSSGQLSDSSLVLSGVIAPADELLGALIKMLHIQNGIKVTE